MSDLPQDYKVLSGLDKNYIPLKGQTLSREDCPELYNILNQTILPLVEKYAKSKQDLDQQKQ